MIFFSVFCIKIEIPHSSMNRDKSRKTSLDLDKYDENCDFFYCTLWVSSNDALILQKTVMDTLDIISVCTQFIKSWFGLFYLRQISNHFAWGVLVSTRSDSQSSAQVTTVPEVFSLLRWPHTPPSVLKEAFLLLCHPGIISDWVWSQAASQTGSDSSVPRGHAKACLPHLICFCLPWGSRLPRVRPGAEAIIPTLCVNELIFVIKEFPQLILMLKHWLLTPDEIS